MLEEKEIKFRQKFPDDEREKICTISQKELFLEGSKEALDYLKNKRLFNEEIIKKMEFGYVPKQIMNRLGVRHELAGRIVIPIRNQYGKLVALSSRDWREGAFMPFWHESFEKGIYLYGLHIAKHDIISNKKVILVEGQFDVAKLWQSGINFVVGILGSAPQLHQIAVLSRYCKEIFIVFDGDKAGKAATERMRQIFRENNINDFDINIIPVLLPENYDPDDFLKTKGRQEFINLLKATRDKYYLGKE